MPQSIILFVPDQSNLLKLFENLAPELDAVPHTSEGSIQLQGSTADSRWYIDLKPMNLEKIHKEYSDHEFIEEQFIAEMHSFSAFLVSFNDYESVMSSIHILLEHGSMKPETIWIDTDYGWLLRGDVFLSEVAVNSDYDWRIDPWKKTDQQDASGDLRPQR